MTSIIFYSIFLAFIVSSRFFVNRKHSTLNILLFFYIDFVQGTYPGDGCCIAWSSDGTCCMNIDSQCCVDAAPDVNYYSTNYYYNGGGYYPVGGWGRVSHPMCRYFMNDMKVLFCRYKHGAFCLELGW